MIKIEMFEERVGGDLMQRKPGKYYDPLMVFISDETKKSLVFSCSNITEAQCCRQAVSNHIRKYNLNAVVAQRNCTVYVLKG